MQKDPRRRFSGRFRGSSWDNLPHAWRSVAAAPRARGGESPRQTRSRLVTRTAPAYDRSGKSAGGKRPPIPHPLRELVSAKRSRLRVASNSSSTLMRLRCAHDCALEKIYAASIGGEFMHIRTPHSHLGSARLESRADKHSRLPCASRLLRTLMEAERSRFFLHSAMSAINAALAKGAESLMVILDTILQNVRRDREEFAWHSIAGD